MGFQIGELVQAKVKGNTVFGEILDLGEVFTSILDNNNKITEVLTKNLRLLF